MFLLSTVFYQIIVQPRTPLEEEVAAVLRGSAHVLERSNKELTEEEEKALLAMDLEEVHAFLRNWSFLIPRGHAPFGRHQKLQPLDRPKC